MDTGRIYSVFFPYDQMIPNYERSAGEQPVLKEQQGSQRLAIVSVDVEEKRL